MKTPLIGFLLLCITQFSLGQEVQTDTTKNTSSEQPQLLAGIAGHPIPSSTPRDGAIYFSPAFGKSEIDDLGYYANTINPPQLFHLSAGLSVINTLRGQAAGLSITPQAMDAALSTPGNGNLFVIDGLPYNNISDHYNLNALEFQCISVINSGNAASRYGGGGLNSVILLQRKNGAGITGPSFEVNSYTTFASNKIPSIIADETTTIDRWLFTNGIAYAQDFGAIDTRVSYTFSRFPSNDDYPVANNIHATSINTGLELGDRFKARLILDQFARLGSMDESSQYANANIEDSYSGKETFLQGNLSLIYQLTKGISLSSQAAMSRVKDRLARLSERTGEIGFTNVYNREYEHQQRTFINLFLNGTSDLSNGWNLHYAVGYQIEKSNPYVDMFTSQSGFDFWSEYQSKIGYDISTKSLLGEFGISYNKFLFFTTNYQHNDFDEENNDTYTFAGNFTFSEAFQWKGSAFSFGNIRANYGKADLLNNATFPVTFTTDLFQTSQLKVGGSRFETGVDFGFLNNRISLSANRFYNTNDNTYMWAYLYLGNGIQHTLVDVGETDIKGWSLIAGAKIIDNANLKWTAKINWQTSKTVIRKNNYITGDIVVSPGWQAGIVNQFEMQHWFASLLIDTNYDADYINAGYFPDSGLPYYTIEDVNQTKLRDVSVGYTLSPTKTNGPLIRISLSARNLWTIHSTSDSDFENSRENYTTLKNFSVSIGATF